MKTAMQELLEDLKTEDYNSLEQLINRIENIYIQDEKLQIIEAINEWCRNDNILTPEQYYEETYNQNK